MPEARVTVYAVFGDPQMGVWCDGCQLPARVVWPVHLLRDSGVTSGATAEKCLNGCHRRDDCE